MRLLMQVFVVIFISILGTPQSSLAKTYAYIMGPEGEIIKLDTDTNAITQVKLKIPAGTILEGFLDADTVNNYLYTIHGPRLGPYTVGVYNLKTLSFIKEFPFLSGDADIQMILYPDRSKFLIQYFDTGDVDEEGGYTTDLYNAKALTRIQNLETIFAMEKIMFSSDSKKIYSVIGGSEPKVNIIDSTTFQVLESRDLIQIKKPDIFSSGIKNFSSGKILIFENLQTAKGLTRKLDLYVYDIETQAISPKISTGLQGDAMLTAGGAKIIFDENEDIREIIGSKSYLMGFRSLGRLHIYDVATGKELRTISFKAQGKGKVIGIRPAGDRLYYQSEGLTKDTYNITVINIKDYYVMTTISLPFKAFFVTFFEE